MHLLGIYPVCGIVPGGYTQNDILVSKYFDIKVSFRSPSESPSGGAGERSQPFRAEPDTVRSECTCTSSETVQTPRRAPSGQELNI